MNRRLTIVAATPMEIAPTLRFLEKEASRQAFQSFQYHGLQIDILYTGIGIMACTYSLMEYISHRHPDGWIQLGIGGAYDTALTKGDVYLITRESIVGLGAQQPDGNIHDPFIMGWLPEDIPPYQRGYLQNPYHPHIPIPQATGMTSLHAHGETHSIARLASDRNGQIENMEGAPFFYISLLKKIPFMSLRSISNMVESRNTAAWNIPLAVENLNDIFLEWCIESEWNIDKILGIGDHSR